MHQLNFKILIGYFFKRKGNVALHFITLGVRNNIDRLTISVAIEEIAENEWMEKVYDTEIRPNFERLYKKTGY